MNDATLTNLALAAILGVIIAGLSSALDTHPITVETTVTRVAEHLVNTDSGIEREMRVFTPLGSYRADPSALASLKPKQCVRLTHPHGRLDALIEPCARANPSP